jgi:hypothetical protein
MARKATATNLADDQISNGAENSITPPYSAAIRISGTAPILMHRYCAEAVEEKGKAAKGSKAKKSDDLESYMYRATDGTIAIPGEYLKQSIVHAGKYLQDPRSPRKSAMDLLRAGVISFTEFASFGVADPDYLDRRRVVIQRNAITRVRPAMNTGWSLEFIMQVVLAEYITPQMLHMLVTNAGRLIGIGDFRPSFGRFQLDSFSVLTED